MATTASPPTTLCIKVERGRHRSHHVLTLNRYVKGSEKLSDTLAAIGSDNQFTCHFSTGPDGKTTVEVDILSGNREGAYTSKLCRIVLMLASITHTPEDDVTIDIDKAVTLTLAELHRALQFQSGKAYAVDITVRELGSHSA